MIPQGAPKILSVTEITPKAEKAANGGEFKTTKPKPTMSSTFETVIQDSKVTVSGKNFTGELITG